MTDRLLDQREWEAQERYLRYSSHADNAKSFGDMVQCGRWRLRAYDAKVEWQNLVKERESRV